MSFNFNLFSYFSMKVHCKNKNIIHNLNNIYNKHNGEKKKGQYQYYQYHCINVITRTMMEPT